MDDQMAYDAYLQLLADEAGDRKEAFNVLSQFQFYESRKQQRKQTLRDQHIEPNKPQLDG